MDRSYFSKEILPLGLIFAALVVGMFLFDGLLHLLDIVWIGRYLGIPGVLLILLSMLYSLRKRKVLQSGNPRTLLQFHKFTAWLGALLVLVHAGIHFNAILPWLAIAAMLINVVSGLTGAFLISRARRHVESRRSVLSARGMNDEEIETRLFWDALTLKALRRWHDVHFPIAFAFAALALIHILSIFLFWEWR